MAGFYSLESKEVIRVKVKKCDGMMQPEYKKFSIDPQITSFEMLMGILAKAFDIKGEFMLSYLAQDSEGQEVYLSMLSDWDMDAAFQCAADPCLRLKVDLKPFEDGLEDWDVIAPLDIPHHRISSLAEKGSLLGTITGSITSGVGRTMSTVSRAMGFRSRGEDIPKAIKPAMSDQEFSHYLDCNGYMIKPDEFRLSIYQGGIEPSLRRVAWRHLLNVFPSSLSGRERFDYMRKLEMEYYMHRDAWKELFSKGVPNEEVKHVASMVKKDVLRTDRNHKFYAGSDENKNILSLLHILVTYALTHPNVSYCQGMSDLASPLLFIQKDEAQAYFCFCGLMNKLKDNFTSEEGLSMTKQFQHLSMLIQLHDPELFAHLEAIGAADFFFTYRWLLLGLKREFPLEDALYMLEVTWSTFPPSPPQEKLELVEADYNDRVLSESPCSPTFSFQQTVYAKLLARRRLGPARQREIPASKNQQLNPGNLGSHVRVDVSPLDEDKGSMAVSQEYPCLDDPVTRAMQKRASSIDKSLETTDSETDKDFSFDRSNSSEESEGKKANGEHENEDGCDEITDSGNQEFLDSLEVGTMDVGEGCSVSGAAWTQQEKENEGPMQFHLSLETSGETVEMVEIDTTSVASQDSLQGKQQGLFSSMKRLLASPKRRPGNINIPREISSTSAEPEAGTRHTNGVDGGNLSDSHTSDSSDAMDSSSLSRSRIAQLPPPSEFGGGNPFLMFLCLTLLLQHREHILRNRMEYSDLVMYFDRMVRRHNVHHVLHQARQLYTDYLRSQSQVSPESSSVSNSFSSDCI